MKTKAKALFLVAAVAATLGGHALGQPAGTQPNAKIDPHSGLPTGPGLTVSNSSTKSINSATSLPQDNGGHLALLLQAQAFTTSGQYEQALKCFLRLDAQAQAATNNVLLKTALPDWVKLGKKYPAAQQALIDIRDLDTREFTQGWGDLQLFQKAADINEVFGDDAATVDLFKSLRQNHPSQAREWCLYVEPALVRRGEYQMCLDCIGNPETLFNIYCRTLQQSYGQEAFMAERSSESRRRALEILQQPGRPPVPPYLLRANHADDIALHTITNSFAGKVSCLVEILVHTGHQELADKIRGEAAAVLDGLHSPASMSGAEETAKAGADWPPGYPWTMAAAGGNSATNLPMAASRTPCIVAPSNQFYGPTLEVTLNVNDNRLSDILNLDYGTEVSLRDENPQPEYIEVRLPENGIAIKAPHHFTGEILSPLEVVSKRTQLFQCPPMDRGAWNEASPPTWLRLPDEMRLVGLNILFDRARASQGLPVLLGFQTSLGNAGLMEITGFTDHPRGVTVRYKLLHNPNPPEIPNPDASPEDWSPAQPPTGKPALAKFRQGIKKLMDQDRYAEALERQVWYYNHALQCGDTEVTRLSFGIMYWVELNRRYPKAKQAMINIRDRAVREFSAAAEEDKPSRFEEISFLAHLVHDGDATVALFKTIDQQNPKLARKCYNYTEADLAHQGEYALCLKYLGDPQAKFDGICAVRQNMLHGLDHISAAEREREEKNAAEGNQLLAAYNGQTLQEGILKIKTPTELTKQAAQGYFVQETHRLIEILVATGHRADAEKICAEAVLVVGDPSLKSAVTDAELKTAK